MDIRDQIASVVLVDPVSILLHLPDVAYNFVGVPILHFFIQPPEEE